MVQQRPCSDQSTGGASHQLPTSGALDDLEVPQLVGSDGVGTLAARTSPLGILLREPGPQLAEPVIDSHDPGRPRIPSGQARAEEDEAPVARHIVRLVEGIQ